MICPAYQVQAEWVLHGILHRCSCCDSIRPKDFFYFADTGVRVVPIHRDDEICLGNCVDVMKYIHLSEFEQHKFRRYLERNKFQFAHPGKIIMTPNFLATVIPIKAQA